MQKSTLHNFWRIAQLPPPQDQLMAMDYLPSSNGDRRCEDCDGSLVSEDTMDMGDFGALGDDKTCQNCKRSICDSCAVIRSERICTACASH
jgi:hypothetical protein